MKQQLFVRRILLAEATLLSALFLAILAFSLLTALGVPESGRDPLPLFLLSALAVACSGFFAAYRLALTSPEHLVVLTPWFLLLYGLVSFGTGLVVPDALFLSWFTIAAATLTLPWLACAFLGAWARRKHRKR
ncbi:MAG: hypothetical protein M0Q49_09820 [Porticoccaceae bacterium]|nr:hypothetical protein [Porticoccaceae bacterium]